MRAREREKREREREREREDERANLGAELLQDGAKLLDGLGLEAPVRIWQQQKNYTNDLPVLVKGICELKINRLSRTKPGC